MTCEDTEWSTLIYSRDGSLYITRVFCVCVSVSSAASFLHDSATRLSSHPYDMTDSVTDKRQMKLDNALTTGLSAFSC